MSLFLKNKYINLREIKNVLFLASLGFIFSIFLAKPKIYETAEMLQAKDNLWEAIEFKKEHILSNLEHYSAHSGEAKYVFRLSVPVIMKVFNLDTFQMYFIQIILGFLIFVLWVSIFKEFIKDKKLLILITLCLSSCYFGKAFNIDSSTPVNVLSYFLILFAIKFRNNPLLLCLSLILLFFNDERGILAFSLIGLFILFFNKTDNVFRIFSKPLIILISCFFVCFIFRFVLILVYGMHLPLGDIGYKVFTNQWTYLHLGVFSGITGFSIVFSIQLKNELLNKQHFFFFTSLFVILIFIIGSSIVSDITKSIAFITPLFILFIYRMSYSIKVIKTIVYSVLVVNILFPTKVIVGNKQFEYYNMTFDIIFKIHSLFV